MHRSFVLHTYKIIFYPSLMQCQMNIIIVENIISCLANQSWTCAIKHWPVHRHTCSVLLPTQTLPNHTRCRHWKKEIQGMLESRVEKTGEMWNKIIRGCRISLSAGS